MEQHVHQLRRKTLVVAALAYAGAALLSLIAATILLELRTADLHAPFEYWGDALYYSSAIKSIVDHGWFWKNTNLGAPAGLRLYDYPNLAHESFHLLTIKVMAIFSRDWALLLNLYFLAGFPLITVSAMAVFRRLGISWGPAAAGGLLYSFLPSRIIKGEGHIFLDTFYQVPLAILVLVWICGESPPFWQGPREPAPATPGWSRARVTRAVFAVGVCLLSSSTSSYYSFFTICLLVIAGIWGSVEHRSWRNAIAAAVLATTIVAGMGFNGLPSILYQRWYGPNPAGVGHRAAQEAEIFAMRITELLLPTTGHRIRALRQFKWQYDTTAPFVGEGSLTSLGFVAGLGFLALLAALVLRRRSRAASGDDVTGTFAVLNLSAVLLGTIGGFGSLIAYLALPQIRTYSRLVVFIAFFSLFPVLRILDRFTRARPVWGHVAVILVVVLGLFDQTTPAAVREYARQREAFLSDRAFVQEIEKLVAPGDIVFQLPHIDFPEGVRRAGLDSNDLLRPYLHSSTLRWSLPTMVGRSSDAVIRDTSERRPDLMLETLAKVGYGGILILRDGYTDFGAAVESGLQSLLGAAPISSPNGRLAFFSLADYRRRAPPKLSSAEIISLLYPLGITFDKGFFGLEHDDVADFHWCQGQGEIIVDNDTPFARRAQLRATLMAARPPAALTISGDLLSEHFDLGTPVRLARTIEIPPGRHIMRFDGQGQPAIAPDDHRTLIWRVFGFALDDSMPARP